MALPSVCWTLSYEIWIPGLARSLWCGVFLGTTIHSLPPPFFFFAGGVGERGIWDILVFHLRGEQKYSQSPHAIEPMPSLSYMLSKSSDFSNSVLIRWMVSNIKLSNLSVTDLVTWWQNFCNFVFYSQLVKLSFPLFLRGSMQKYWISSFSTLQRSLCSQYFSKYKWLKYKVNLHS